jgi:hypothetical protein
MEAATMTEITLKLDPAVVLFYSRIADARDVSLEQILSDALFKLAGELSLQALRRNNYEK